MSDHVIVLHGMLRTHRHMRRLALALEAAGYSVHNLDYPSRRDGMHVLLEGLHTMIVPRITGAARVHFVGYSMGALLVRAYIHRYRPAQLGAVVQLAPPNNGSEIADALRNFPPYRWLFGPAGQQLGTCRRPDSLFGPVDYPLGILAGTRSLDPFCGLLLTHPHDGKVTVASTKLEGARAHTCIRASHMFFPTHRDVIANSVHFLRYGKFLNG